MIHEELITQLTERSSRTIDAKWIKGIRKWWKRWVSKNRSYPGRVTKPNGKLPPFPVPIYAEDWSIEGGTDWTKQPRIEMWEKHIKPGGEAALRYLDEGIANVESLRRDLLLNKGLFTLSQSGGVSQFSKKELEADPQLKGAAERLDLKVRVAKLLDEATRILKDGRNRVESYVKWTNPSASANFRMYPEIWNSESSFKGLVQSSSSVVLEVTIGANAVISRKLLAALTRYLGKRNATSVTMGGVTTPDQLMVGNARVVFHDLPAGPISRFSRESELVRDPRDRETTIKKIIGAKSALKAKGLGRVFKGAKFHIYAKGSAPENQYGAHLGVAANYSRKLDLVSVFSNRVSSNLVIHELGHRYWYKFMRKTDRAHFDKWFGKVAATSSYGAINTKTSRQVFASVEDFAEVFADYVMGTNKDLSRDQVGRLKSVLHRKKRQESLDDEVDSLVEMSARQVMKKLRKAGCVELRQKGSHVQVKCGTRQSTVPSHGSKDIKKGTLKSIEKSLNIDLDGDGKPSGTGDPKPQSRRRREGLDQEVAQLISGEK